MSLGLACSRPRLRPACAGRGALGDDLVGDFAVEHTLSAYVVDGIEATPPPRRIGTTPPHQWQIQDTLTHETAWREVTRRVLGGRYVGRLWRLGIQYRGPRQILAVELKLSCALQFLEIAPFQLRPIFDRRMR